MPYVPRAGYYAHLQKPGAGEKQGCVAHVLYVRPSNISDLPSGLHYCTHGKHEVTVAECTAADGTVRANCIACLARRQEAYARAADARAQREVENQGDGDGLAEEDEGVQTVPTDEFDAIFGDGSDLMDVDLPEDNALVSDEAQCLRKVRDALDALRFENCGTCREEGFHIKLRSSGMCARCASDKKDVRKWSDENRVNPTPDAQVPPCLKNLTEMERMLIARVKTVMQVRWTRG
ncbi:hypothetical protein FB45DRAFT_743710, partial [Roridomyces roridus]